MKKLILSAAIAAALFSTVAAASDDDYRSGSTSTVNSNNRNSNANRNSNRNANTNTQRQQQVARGGSARSSAQGGNATGGNASANGNGSGNVTNITDSYSEARNVAASAATPFLVTSGEDTCLGSVGGGVQTQILGLSGGKTVVDENCVLIKNTKLLIAMGYDSAACYYVRQNPQIDQAMTAAGVECREPSPIEAVPIPSDPENKSAAIIRNQYK